MNLSDLIDKLLEVEIKCRATGLKSPIELPVYFIDDQGFSFQVMGNVEVLTNEGDHEMGELLDLKLFEKYVRLG